MLMEKAVVTAAGMVVEDVEEVDILEDSLDIVDFQVVETFPVDLLASVEDLVAEDTVNTCHTAARVAIAEDIAEAATVDTTGVMFRASITEDITIQEDITEAIRDTIMADMLHMVPPLDSSLAEWLLEVCTIRSGGLITIHRYLRDIMMPIRIHIRTLLLHI
jgi:hypothetical protein